MRKIYFLLFALIGGIWLNAQTFSSATPITLGTATTGPFSPYPSDITVAGVGNIGSVSVTLFDISHTWAGDVEVLLVGPTGATSILLADQMGGTDFVNANLTFETGGAAIAAVTGTYAPIGGAFDGPAPAPAGPHNADLTVFDFTNADGVWSLYVNDNTNGDGGSIAGGWSITFTPAPTCIPPSGLSASALATSAELTWNSPTGAATLDQVEIGAPGFALGSPSISSSTFVDTLNVSGLSPATDYEYYVRTVCGPADTSTWSGPFAFTTPCLPYIAPYTESFDAGTIDPCATLSAAAGGPWRLGVNFTWNTCTAPTDHTGNGGSFISNDMSTPDAAVVFQMNDVDVSALTTPYLDMYHYMCGTWNNEVYIEAWDGSTWAQVGLINTSSPTWENYGFDLTGFTFGANLVRVRFRLEEGSTGTGFQFNSDVALDDLSIIEAPTCFVPSNLAAANVSSDTADVSWTENFTATQWEVQYGVTGFALGTGTSVFPSGTPNTTLTGLTELTTYDFYLRAICGPGDTSAWSAPVSFTTELAALSCPPGTGAPFAIYQTSFEDAGCTGASNWLGFDGFTQVATGTAGAWRRECSGTTGSGWIDAGPFDGSDYAYFETTSATGANTSDTLTSPTLDISTLAGGARATGYFLNGGNSTFIVERSLDGGPWTNVLTDTGLGGGSAPDLGEWTLFVDNFSSAIGTASTIAWRFIGVSSGVTNQGDIGLDLLTVEACVSCLPPSNETVNVLSFDSAVLEFDTYSGASLVYIEYGPAPLTPGTGDSIVTTLDSIVLSGLTASTDYQILINSDCSVSTGDTSTALGPISFTTPCGPYVPVYFEDFTTWTGTTSLPDCWEEYNQVTPATFAGSTPSTAGQWLQDGFGNDASSPFSVTATVGAARIELWNLSDQDWLVSPEIDLSAGGPYQLDFNWTITRWNLTTFEQISDDDYVAVLITTDGGVTWTELGRYDSSTVITATPVGQTAIYDLTAYSGSVVRIGFFGDEGTVDDASDVNFYMDNFRVRPIPTCPEPVALNVSNVTFNSVDLDWTETGSATAWEVEYGAPGFTLGTGTVVAVSGSPSTTVSGLMDQTAYEFVVRSICGAGDTSLYTFASSATTLCAPLAAPALEDYETVPVGAFGDLGNCWFTTPTSGYRWESENSTGVNENSLDTGPFTDKTLEPAAGGIYMYTEATNGVAGDTAFLNSPLVDLSGLANPNITFWYHMYGDAMGDLLLQINDGSGWTTITTISGQQQTSGGEIWRKSSNNILSYSGIVSFRFVGIRGTSFTSDMSIDDVSIQEAPTNEIAVSSIDAPMSGCGMASTPLTITVDNNGVNDLFYVPVVVQLAGDYSGVYTLVVDTLPALSTVQLTLDSVSTLAGGSMDVNAFTNLANDTEPLNDTTAATFTFDLVPAAPAIMDVVACAGETVDVGFGSVGLLSWFESDTSSASFFEGDTLSYTGGDTTFYVMQQEVFNGTATLDMFDSFGDGWNGATLEVSINGVPAIGSPFTIGTGSTGQATFDVANGDSLTLNMTSGTFDGEISYTITGPDGEVIFEDGFTAQIAIGQVYNDELSLVGCPSDLSMVQIGFTPVYLDSVPVVACDSIMLAGAMQTVSGFYTDSLTTVAGCDSVVVFNLTINNSYAETSQDTICDNGSFTLPDGVVVSLAGTYTSVLTAANGCDSVITTELEVVSAFEVNQAIEACEGDTIVVGTSEYTVTGMYVDSLLSVDGCDSVVTTNLLVYPAVDVTIGGVTVVCENAPAVSLTLDPVGGVLSGPGVIDSVTFDPAAAGLGVSTLTYTFADGNGCDATASLDVEVVVCTGIEDIEGIETLSIYPNPYISTINLLFDDAIAGELNIKLFDVTGKVLLNELVNTAVGANTISLEVSSEVASGVHFLQIERDGAVYSTTIIKK